MSDEGMTDTELRELASRDHTKGCDMRYAACSCGYEGALEAAVPALIARLDAAERERDHYRKLAFDRIDQSAANGWLPIASAPMNGSKIDLWSESHYGNGRIPDAWYVGNEWFVFNSDTIPESIAHHHKITHWRPILAPALTANHSAPVVEE